MRARRIAATSTVAAGRPAAAPRFEQVLASASRNASGRGREIRQSATRGRTERRSERSASVSAPELAATRLAVSAAPAARAAAPAAAPAAGRQEATPPSATRRAASPRVLVVDARTRAQPAKAEEAKPTAEVPLAAARAAAVPEAPAARDAVPQARTASSTGATPLERLREMTGSDLVRTAALVVRDGGGEIRLTLRPESLGSVRIRLRLADHAVDGRIIVDTPAAKAAFDAGLEALTRALHAEGFETGFLEVSVGGQSADGRHETAEGPVGQAVPAARGRAAEALAAGVPDLRSLGTEELLVDVMA